MQPRAVATSIHKVRILMVSPQYRPIVGGYERAAERLSVVLAARGHRVTVIAERRNTAWLQEELIDGICVRRLWCAYRPRFHTITALASFAMFLLAEGRRFDVWHVHQYGHHAALAVTLGKVLRRPIVLKLTNTADQGLAHSAASGRFASLTTFLLKRATAVVALTREMVGEAKAFGISAERIHCLGNGVDTALFCSRDQTQRALLKQVLGIGASRVVLFVGRLAEEKNPQGLIQAWTAALSSLPVDWKLVFVGNGPMRDALEASVEGQCRDGSVLFAGQQNNIEQWMGAADIYVLSSRNEGLSNTLLEAMASGLPVVATRVSGISELVEEPGAGLVAAVGDMDALAQALVQLASDNTLREKMGAIGRQVISERYSIEVVAARHEDMYRRLLADGAR